LSTLIRPLADWRNRRVNWKELQEVTSLQQVSS